MDHKEVLKRVDHTLLTQAATWEEVQAICDEGMACETASVCVPPRYGKRAADYVKNRLKICTVVGFPNGYSTPEVKVFETEDAIRNGADEIDMVINIPIPIPNKIIPPTATKTPNIVRPLPATRRNKPPLILSTFQKYSLLPFSA